MAASGGQRVETEKDVFAPGEFVGPGILGAAEQPKKQQQQGQLGRPPPPSPGNPQGAVACYFITFVVQASRLRGFVVQASRLRGFVVQASRLHRVPPRRPHYPNLVQARRLHRNRRRRSGVRRPADWPASIRRAARRTAAPRRCERSGSGLRPPLPPGARWSSAVRRRYAGGLELHLDVFPRPACLAAGDLDGQRDRCAVVHGPLLRHDVPALDHQMGRGLAEQLRAEAQQVDSRCSLGMRFKALSLQKAGSTSSPCWPAITSSHTCTAGTADALCTETL